MGPKNCLVQFGFCSGHLLADDNKLLKSDGRKHVFIMPINSLKDIHEKAVNELLQEALMVDDYQFNKKRKRK